MATFLDLVQELVRESHVHLSGPSSVHNQTGDFKDSVEWIRESWSAIQNKHVNWLWMRRGFNLNLIDGRKSYDHTHCIDNLNNQSITRFSRWFLSGTGNEIPYIKPKNKNKIKQYLIYYDWSNWRLLQYDISDKKQKYPAYYTITPQKQIQVYPTPNTSDYSLCGEYKIGPQVLVDDDDEPEGLEETYHRVIVWHAMLNYAYAELATELLALRDKRYRELMKLMERSELPQIRLGQPLA